MRIYKTNELDELAKILKKDGVISVPTDTVYGVCACMNSKKAYNKLMKIKNRPLNKLLPIMCADENQIKSIAILNENAEKIIHAFMPGPITLILKKKFDVPEYVNNGGNSIAIRMATSIEIKELIMKVGSPLFMSSANQSGDLPCKNLNEIKEKLPDLDGILEGDITYGKSSTIVDCTLDQIKILREGPILEEQIKKCLELKIIEK